MLKENVFFSTGNWGWDVCSEEADFGSRCESNCDCDHSQAKCLALEAWRLHQNNSSCKGNAAAFGPWRKTFRLASSTSEREPGLRPVPSLLSQIQRRRRSSSHPSLRKYAAQQNQAQTQAQCPESYKLHQTTLNWFWWVSWFAELFDFTRKICFVCRLINEEFLSIF